MPPFRAAPAAAPAPTIADRLGEAAALAGYALDVFRTAAGDLETAARLHEEIAAEAERVANEHLAIATSATGQASAAQKQADKIRELIA
jgi:Sec-independent protein translocase protein TatA